MINLKIFFHFSLLQILLNCSPQISCFSLIIFIHTRLNNGYLCGKKLIFHYIKHNFLCTNIFFENNVHNNFTMIYKNRKSFEKRDCKIEENIQNDVEVKNLKILSKQILNNFFFVKCL